jgi:hypothetical protein
MKPFYTVKDLKEIIKDLPDNTPIGGVGAFGEFLECFTITPSKVTETIHSKEIFQILAISIENVQDID